MTYIRLLLETAFFCAGLLGWGGVARKGLGVAALGAGTEMVLGIALFAWLGGWLNLFGVAFGRPIDMLLLLGLACLVWNLWRAREHRRTIKLLFLEALSEPAYYLILLASLFSFICLSPTTIFNAHDDFGGYLMRIQRMLQTGSLAGDAFNSPGLDALGTQSFLQAFFVAHFGDAYAGLFDWVIAASVVWFILVEVGRALGNSRLARLVAVVTGLAINPYVVNISANYSEAALILAMVSLAVRRLSLPAETGGQGRLLVGMAMLASMMIAFKASLLLFDAIILIGVIAMRWQSAMAWPDKLSRLGGTLLWCGLTLLPWLGLYWPLYRDTGALMMSHQAPPLTTGLLSVNHVFDMWTNYLQVNPAPHRERSLITTCTCSIFMIILVYFVRGRGGKDKNTSQPMLWVISLFCFSAIFDFALEPVLTPGSSIRYFLPVIIALIPVCLLFMHSAFSIGRGWRYFATLSALMVIMAHADTLYARIKTMADFHTPFIWSASDLGVEWDGVSFRPETQKQLRDLQHLFPAGTKMLVYVYNPFLLDFKSFPTWTIAANSLDRPWIPDLTGASEYRVLEFVKRQGISSIIWQKTESSEFHYNKGDPTSPRWGVVLRPDEWKLAQDKGMNNFDALWRLVKSLRVDQAVVYENDEFIAVNLPN